MTGVLLEFTDQSPSEPVAEATVAITYHGASGELVLTEGVSMDLTHNVLVKAYLTKNRHANVLINKDSLIPTRHLIFSI